MKLEKFQIINCFGFDDSREIQIHTPENLTYLLGRNSSGKTSVLTALASFEYGRIPSNYPRFTNFESTGKRTALRAKFVLEAGDTANGLTSGFIDQVMQAFASTGLQLVATEDGLEIRRGGQADRQLTTLIEGIATVYSELVRRIVDQGAVWVEKLANGSYIISLKPGDRDGYQERQERMQDWKSAAISQGQVVGAHGQSHPVTLDPLVVEGYLFKRFPEIYFFTEAFSLGDDLPRALDNRELNNPQNSLTGALVSVLGRGTVRSLLQANRTTTISRVEAELNSRLDALNGQINEDVAAGVEDGDFVSLVVRKLEGVELLVTVDEGESYYEHISDNTKFLIAYHLFQAQRRHNDSLGSVLLFDEPNRGFHPSAEGKLLRFLETLAEDNQVVIATHSQHLIDLERLSGVRVMGKSDQNYLSVHNMLYEVSGASQDTLALQPITDAIGLKYANHLVANREVVIVEGYTDLIYLLAFARLLGYDPPNLAPVTGDGKIRTLASFLVSQGVAFKVLVDETHRKRELMSSFPIPKLSCLVVEEFAGLAPARTKGIEDLFTKDDFRLLLPKTGHPTNDHQLNVVSNSEYAKSHGIKRLIAETANTVGVLDIDELDADTRANFQTALDFCANDKWFQI